MPMEAIFGIALTAAFAVRLILYKRELTWLKNLCFCLFVLLCLFIIVAATGAAPTRADGDAYRVYLFRIAATALLYTVLTHFITRFIARRKEMNPKRHESGRQPVRHGRPAQLQPVRHGEAADPIQPAAPHTPASQPNVTAAPPTPTPEAPKPPVRQTLRTCVRCGHSLTGPFCGECGYNHTGSEVRFLRFVDPERLQISIRKN